MKYNKLLLVGVVLILVAIAMMYFGNGHRVEINDVWYINLDRDVERNEHYKTIAHLFEVPVHRWAATYGRDVTRTQAAQEYGVCSSITRSDNDEENKKNPNVIHVPGVVGCWISHKRLLTHLNTLSLPSHHGHLITEDDINVPQDFQEKWASLRSSIPNNWDIIYFYVGRPHGDSIAPNILRWKNDVYAANWGTVAYMVRHGAIPRILYKLRYMDSPIDVQYYRHFSDLNVYIIDPVLISTGDFESTINKKE